MAGVRNVIFSKLSFSSRDLCLGVISFLTKNVGLILQYNAQTKPETIFDMVAVCHWICIFLELKARVFIKFHRNRNMRISRLRKR